MPRPSPVAGPAIAGALDVERARTYRKLAAELTTPVDEAACSDFVANLYGRRG